MWLNFRNLVPTQTDFWLVQYSIPSYTTSRSVIWQTNFEIWNQIEQLTTDLSRLLSVSSPANTVRWNVTRTAVCLHCFSVTFEPIYQVKTLIKRHTKYPSSLCGVRSEIWNQIRSHETVDGFSRKHGLTGEWEMP